MSLLWWAFLFLIFAVVLAVLGFGILSAAAAGVAKILFYIFLFIFIVSLIAHLARRV